MYTRRVEVVRNLRPRRAGSTAESVEMLTFELNTIPESSEAHELPIFAFREVWYLFLAIVLLQPLIEALCDYNAAFLFLHGRPHTTIFKERIVSTVDGLHFGAIIRIPLRPEWHETCDFVSVMAFQKQFAALTPLH